VLIKAALTLLLILDIDKFEFLNASSINTAGILIKLVYTEIPIIPIVVARDRIQRFLVLITLVVDSKINIDRGIM
jgi:hypothetical protein